MGASMGRKKWVAVIAAWGVLSTSVVAGSLGWVPAAAAAIPADPVPALTTESFLNPPRTARPKYRFWVPSANTEDAELRAEVAQIAAAGAGGIELVGFQDTGVNPDLATIGWGTAQWTQKLQVILAAAAEYGLTVDQNLGPSYPPTVPTVTDINDPAAAKQLVYATKSVQSGFTFSGPLPAVTTPSGATTRTVAVVAARCVQVGCVTVSGPTQLDRSSVIDLTGKVENNRITWTAPAGGGTWKLFNFQQTADGTSKSGFSGTGTNYVVDHLSKAGAEALASFYDANIMTPTTQSLIDRLPGPASFFEDSLEMGHNQLWTTEFGDQFTARRGYSIATALPAMTGIGPHGTTTPAFDFSDGSGQRIRGDYQQTWSDLYLDTYATTLASWAHTHNMLFRTQAYGNPIQTGAASMVVGIPEGENINFSPSNPLGAEQNYRVVAGGAHVAGKNRISAECCGTFFGAYRTTAGGPDTSHAGPSVSGLNGNLDTIAKAYAGGVTQLVWHGFPYLKAPLGQVLVGQGGLWPGYNPWAIAGAIDVSEMFGPRMPQWSDYRGINDKLAREQLVLRQGAPNLDLSVYFQDVGLAGASVATGGGVTPAETPAHQFSTTGPLTAAGYTFEYHPQQAYLKSSGVFSNGTLFPGNGSEKALVLNNQATMPLDAAQRILDLAKQGLRVVVIGSPPARVPGDAKAESDAALASTISQLLAQPTVRSVADEAGAVGALGEMNVQPAAKPASTLTTPIETVRRDAGTTQYYWLYNPSGEPQNQTITLAGAGRPFSLDPWSGSITPVAQYTSTDSGVSMPITIPEYSTVMYAVTTGKASPFSAQAALHATSSSGTPVYLADGSLAVQSTTSGTVTTALSNGRTVTTDIPTVGPAQRLGTWTLTPETWSRGEQHYETKKTTQPAVTVTALPDGSLPPWTAIPGLTTASGVGTYTTTVDLGSGWTGGFGATLDLGKAVDTVSVTVNGKALPTVNPSSLTVPADYLHSGVNTITVRVATTLFNAVQSQTLSPIYSQTPQQYGLIGPVTLTPYGQAPVVKPKADLKVSALTAAQNKPAETVLTATVANTGGTDTSGAIVQFRNGDTVLGQTEPVAVPAGSTADVSYTWNTRGVKGQQTITATVDPGDVIAEEDETNNSSTSTLTIRGNKVTNGSFEQSANGTSPDGWSSSSQGTSYDTTGAHATDGTSAISIAGTPLGLSPAWSSAPITVDPGQTYNLSAKVASLGIPLPPALQVSFLDPAGRLVGQVTGLTSNLPGTTAVQELLGNVTIPAGVSQIRLTLPRVTDLSGQGTAWYDDIWMW